MSSYYNVERVQELGTEYKLDHFAQQKLNLTGKHDVEEDKRLVMVLDYPEFKIAPDVTDPYELMHFLSEHLYSQHCKSYTLFKVDADKIGDYTDRTRSYKPGFGPQ